MSPVNFLGVIDGSHSMAWMNTEQMKLVPPYRQIDTDSNDC